MGLLNKVMKASRVARRNLFGTWQDMPSVVMLEISSGCNMRCTTCGNSAMKRKRGLMDMALYEHILDQCEKEGIPTLKLFGLGDSFCHPRYVEMIKMAAPRRFESVHISTTGMRLADDTIREVVQTGVFVQFSFGGWDKPSYERIYRGGDFDRAVRQLQLFNQVREEEQQPPEKFVASGMVFPEDGGGEAAKQKVRAFLHSIGLTDCQIEIYYPETNGEYVAPGRKTELKPNAFFHRLYCGILEDRIGILYDGRVTACPCKDFEGVFVIGDIRKQSIREMRNSENYRRLVEHFNRGDVSGLPLCYNCLLDPK